MQLIEGNSAEIENKLLNNEIDLAFYTLPIYASKIEFEVIADDPFVIAAAKTHPFARGLTYHKMIIATLIRYHLNCS